jgi:hypothetical protein
MPYCSNDENIAIRVNDIVSLYVSDSASRATGTVVRIYPNAINVAVADVELPGGRIATANVEFLRLADHAHA